MSQHTPELEDVGCCAHCRVFWTTQTDEHNLTRGWWQCSLCETKFAPVKTLEFAAAQRTADLSDALRKLANEAEAFNSLAVESDCIATFGVTNVRVLQLRIREAREVLAKAEGESRKMGAEE